MYISKSDLEYLKSYAGKHPPKRFAMLIDKLEAQHKSGNEKSRLAMEAGRKVNKCYGQLGNPTAIKRPRVYKDYESMAQEVLS